MDTIAPPASVVNSLFRRPAGKEDERKKREGKTFQVDPERDDEDVVVEAEVDHGAPALPVLHAYAPSGTLAAEDVPVAEGDLDALLASEPGDPIPHEETGTPASASFEEEEAGAEVLAAAILLAEEERLAHEHEVREEAGECKPADPYGSAARNPCGGNTDVET